MMHKKNQIIHMTNAIRFQTSLVSSISTYANIMCPLKIMTIMLKFRKKGYYTNKKNTP
jgi:hypothetical protein